MARKKAGEASGRLVSVSHVFFFRPAVLLPAASSREHESLAVPGGRTPRIPCRE